MIYKKQLKRISKEMIAKNKKRHGLSFCHISPILEKAIKKAEKMRINNGQILISGLEAHCNKDKYIIIAEDFMRDECWVIKRKK
jgi:hypothetical protein